MPIQKACLSCGRLFEPYSPAQKGRCQDCYRQAERERSKRRRGGGVHRVDASGKLISAEEYRRKRKRRTGKPKLPTAAYRKARAKALERDGHQCRMVENGMRREARADLECHHLDGNWHNNDVDNLITLCAEHHQLVERKRRSAAF